MALIFCPYAFLLRLPRSAVGFCWPALSRLFFNAAKMSTTWPVRRGAGFDFLAFDLLLDHSKRALAVFIRVALRLKLRRRHFLDQLMPSSSCSLGSLMSSPFDIAPKSRISSLKNRKCRIRPRFTERIKTRLSLL